jgi:recombination protein RecT
MSVTISRGNEFKAAYRALAPNIAQSLPSHISPEKFERAAMVAVQRSPDLLSKADRKSLFLSLQRAAQDGLMPDGREGAIVLFGNQATWMPMVAGLMKLARNSGEIASISAHVAYKGEKFMVTLGDEERIDHERNLELADNAEIIAAYAVATLKNGEKVREVMTKSQIDKVRRVSKTGGSTSGPWHNWYDQMAIKTAIRRLSKRLPLSTDRDGDERFLRAAEADDDANTIDGVAEAADQGTSKLDALESAITDMEETQSYEGEIVDETTAETTPPTLVEQIEACETKEQLVALRDRNAAFRAARSKLTGDEARAVEIALKAAQHGFEHAATAP